MSLGPSILFVPEFFPSDLQHAAFAERSRALAEELGTSGFDVTVLVLRRSEVAHAIASSEAYTIARRTEWMTRFFYANLPLNMIQRIHAFFDILWRARKARARAVVVSAHDPMFYLAALAAGALLDLPVVTDAHDSRLVLDTVGPRRPKRIVRILLERIAMRWADRIWLPTQGMADLIGRGYGIPRSRILVVANGMSRSRFGAVHHSQPDSHELLHLGGPREYYDSVTLVEALKSVRRVVPDASLVFLGIRDDEYTSSVRRLAEATGLAEAVRFLPPVPPDDVPRYMAKAVAGIHTYAVQAVYAATVGLKVLEYIGAGLPIVHRGPRGGETWRLIEDNGVGLCGQTKEEFADALVRVLSSDDLRKRLSSRAFACAPNYDWTETVRPAVQDLRILIG